MEVKYREEGRIAAVRRYDILDTPQDGSFNRLTRLAAQIFNVPIAIISLVDIDRVWFKSHFGLEVSEIGTEPGLCTSAIMSDDVYIVEDAREDPRTLTNPLVVSDFGLRFYAGAPLQTSDGYNLGTFCIIDKKQRYLTEPQKEILKEMAAIAMDEIEIRLSARKAARQVNHILNTTKSHLHDTVLEIAKIPVAERNQGLTDISDSSREILRQIEDQLDIQA
jgi:GAF domain-containing protein